MKNATTVYEEANDASTPQSDTMTFNLIGRILCLRFVFILYSSNLGIFTWGISFFLRSRYSWVPLFFIGEISASIRDYVVTENVFL